MWRYKIWRKIQFGALFGIGKCDVRNTGSSEMYCIMTFSMLFGESIRVDTGHYAQYYLEKFILRVFSCGCCCCCNVCTNRNESMYLLVELCASVTLFHNTHSIQNAIHFSCWSYYVYYFIGILPSPACVVCVCLCVLLLFFSFGFRAC